MYVSLMIVSSGTFEFSDRMEGFCYTEMETNETSSRTVVTEVVTAMKPPSSIMEQCVWLVLVRRVVVFYTVGRALMEIEVRIF